MVNQKLKSTPEEEDDALLNSEVADDHDVDDQWTDNIPTDPDSTPVFSKLITLDLIKVPRSDFRSYLGFSKSYGIDINAIFVFIKSKEEVSPNYRSFLSAKLNWLVEHGKLDKVKNNFYVIKGDIQPEQKEVKSPVPAQVMETKLPVPALVVETKPPASAPTEINPQKPQTTTRNISLGGRCGGGGGGRLGRSRF